MSDANTNGNQTAKVGNTLKIAYIGMCLECTILVLGIMVLYQTFRKSKKEQENE